MKIFKDTFQKALLEQKARATSQLTSGSVENMQNYGNLTGRVAAYDDIEATFDELWKKYVTNGEGEHDAWN